MVKYLLFLFFYPVLSFSQQAPVPVTNANCIFIQTKESSDKALKQLVYLLQDQGYFIQDYQTVLKFISAYKLGGMHSKAKLWLQAYLREIPETGTRIQIIGHYIVASDSAVSYFEARNWKRLLGTDYEKSAFDRLNKLALAYSLGTVSYQRIE